MKHITQEKEYEILIDDILKNEDFMKIDEIEHHGTSRLTHSMRVSYYSYKLAKKLKLNYSDVARAGLLHDFFMSYEDRTSKERFLSTFTHPKYALINATNNFELNSREKDIIRTHMFPINFAVPKYAESWLVSFVDKCAAFYEFALAIKYQLSYATNYLYFFFILSLIKLH